MTAGPILIVGGYGVVGRLLAEALAPDFADRLLIAGRNAERASSAAEALGPGVRGVRVDAADPGSVASLLAAERPGLVVSCAARTEPVLARAVLGTGVLYLDVSADSAGLASVEALHPDAARSGSAAVLSVGLAPGLTNLLALQVCRALDEVHELDLGVLLSAYDAHGPAAFAWTLDNLAGTFGVVEGGVERSVRPLRESRRLDFGTAWARAGAFNFPEQRSLARTLGVPTVRSWLALRPGVLQAAMGLTVRAGAERPLGWRGVRALLPPLSRVSRRPRPYAVCARAIGRKDGQLLRVTAWRGGEEGEATATARLAARAVRHVLANRPPAGVWHIEQLPDAPALLTG